MVFVADDLAAWLIGALADAGRKKLTTIVVGTDQERALLSAATAAVQRTAGEVRPDDAERAGKLTGLVNRAFIKALMPDAPMAGYATLLEALQAGIAGQLAVVGDTGPAAPGQAPADVHEVPGTALAERLTAHLLREIVARGARGGPLFPLASQLNDDVTHLQGQRLEGILGDVLSRLARLDVARSVAAPVALAQLPPEVTGFTGRDDELAVLADLLDPDTTAGPVLVSAVAGLPGVGKTTLVVAAGHAAQRRGWFGGGVLFIDLHGYDEARVEPAQALDALLRALGVPAEHIPPGVEERAGLYRSVLVQVTEPVLVIADNASSEAQVRPLLPGTGPHKVLVTSRHTLAGLGARLVDVTILDEEASIALLDGVLRAARPSDDRIAADPDAARRLAGACGGLPLALQITAALLTADPVLTAGELAGELSGEKDRLAGLRYDDGSGQGGQSVAAAFELSCRRLDETSARVFRVLPVNPGPDVSTAGAAVLADLPITQVRRVLAGLARAHLAEPAPGAVGRWRMHDLLRLYARRLSEEHADADGREQARDRLLGYYLDRAGAAGGHLRALPGMAVPGEFPGRDAALQWLDAERTSLGAAVQMAADTGRGQAALRLPLLLAEYFSWRRRFDDWIATTTLSLDAARRLGDRQGEAAALTIFGNALAAVRRFDEAITAHQDAAAIFRDTGDRHGEGRALNNLGSALREVRRFDEAITACQDAAAMYRGTGDRHGEGRALANLGAALAETRRFDEAITACQDAAAIFRDTGDPHGEGMALGNLGVALQRARRFDEAITACQDAAAIFRETGDPHGEGMELGNLGVALRQVRRFDEAIAVCQDAAAIFRDTGDRHGEGVALEGLGLALDEAGRSREAMTAYQDAMTIYRETGDQHREGVARENLERAQAARQP